MRRCGQTSRDRKERKLVEPTGGNARSVSGRGNDDGVGAAQTRADRNPSSDRKIAAKRIPYGVVFAAGRPNTVVPRSGQEPETPKIRPNAVWPWPHFRPPTRLPASPVSPSGKGQVQRRNRNTKQKTIKKNRAATGYLGRVRRPLAANQAAEPQVICNPRHAAISSGATVPGFG